MNSTISHDHSASDYVDLKLGEEGPVQSSLFESISYYAARFPKLTAVQDHDSTLTYLELNTHSSRSAALLRQHGVKQGNAVAVCLPRSQELIVLMLAILKAGATVVPLDAASPPNRQAAILADSQARFLITSQEAHSRSVPSATYKTLHVGELVAGNLPDDQGQFQASSVASTAFLFYTSGTTGRPKGVQVPLTAIERLAHQPRFVPMSIGDRYAHISNPAFDALSFDVWVPLLTGGCIVVFSAEETADFEGFARKLEKRSIKTMFMTVSLFNAMVDYGATCFTTLEHLLIGGEQINPHTVQGWYEANPQSTCQIHNIYGPTECATFALSYPIPRSFSGDTVPIGRPIASTDCQLRSSNGEEANPTETAELYIGGAGVAHGYLNREEETQHSFVELSDGRRWYRTGDLVRLNNKGLVEYVGRVDRQVKVRGFRVELEEIEQGLQHFSKVQQAFVLAHQEPGKPLELHAYLTADTRLNYADLNAHMSAHLPDYMRPHQIFCIDEMPLNANGKIDRDAFQKMDCAPLRPAQSSSGTPDEILTDVLETAELVLSVPHLNGEDTMLIAGGDSLKAISLANHLNKTLGYRLVPSQLLNLTFSELADTIRNQGPQLNVLPPVPSPSNISKAHATSEQKRLWLQQQKNPSDTSYNTPFTFRFAGELNPEKLERASRALAKQHPALRTSFHLTDDGVEQHVAQNNPEMFHYHGVLEQNEIAALQNTLFGQPFDLEVPHLFQLHLAHESDGSSVLILHAHHIVLDGWSLNILFEDLSRAYQAQLDEEVSEQAQTSLTTLDFAVWQAQTWESEHYKTQREKLFKIYEEAEFSACWSPVLNSKRAGQEGPAGRTRLMRLDDAHRAKLISTAHQFSLTPHQVFHSLFAHALYAHLGKSRFTIASPVANRNTAEFEATVGMFANTMLLPVVIDPARTIGQNTSALAEVSKRTLACQEVAFEHVVDHLQTTNRLSGLPFQFMFATENTRYETLNLNGEYSPPSFPEHIAPKCPLYLSVLDELETYQFYWEYDFAYFSTEDITQLEQAMLAGLSQVELEEPAGDIFKTDKQQQAAHLKGGDLALTHKTVAAWFQDQVLQTPHASALAWKDNTLSYQELGKLSDALAAHLQSKAIGFVDPSEPLRIALYMDASPEYIIALLALTKLGVTVVPLDLSYPQKLLQAVVSQAKPVAVLHQAGAPYPPELQQGDLLLIPVELEDLKGTQDVAALELTDSGRPLYTLFTSGSTGHPKGVDVYNETLCNLLHWQQEQGELPAAESTMQFSKLAFDVSFQEIFSTLCSGGCFHVIDPTWRQDMRCLLTYMRDNNIERIYMPFVALELFCEAALAFDIFPADLKNVVTAGEQLYCTRALRSFFDKLPQASLHNHYGPTETHVVCVHSLHDSPANWPTRPPIGNPIANTEILLVDDSYQPVVPDEAGHLLIGGQWVRHCYLNNADLNEDQFVELHPNGSSGPSQLYYKTGDIGVLDETGHLNYQGRQDHQVKISGHRVELGQLEMSLIDHDAIEQASVVFDGEHNKLYAYVSLRDSSISADDLDRHLSTRLPDYIRIDEFRQIENWPRTPSGKIDQRALKLCDWLLLETKKRKKHAKNANQRTNQLIAAFEDVVGSSLSADQTFFEAGCSSLQLMRYQMHLSKELGVKVSIADLFRYVTPAKLAEHIEKDGETEQLDSKEQSPQSADKVAIIGMALRVPGADNLAEFWSMVLENRSGIEHFTPNNPDFVGARSQMSEMLSFDPEYFGISPREAALMDPQQRHFMMSCVHALENAGISPHHNDQNIGVIASCGETTYYHAALRSASSTTLPDKFQMALHHEKDFLATKVAFQLDLKGPAITLQAACGSSLVGIHSAAGMLKNGECDVMLAGGVLVDPDMSEGYKYQSQHIFSKDGNCAPFSDKASGTIGASGVGVVVLKCLDRALSDGDRIYAVLEGSAINNDGRSKMSYTSPSVSGQEKVIRQALANADLRGDQIGYVEAHGTGTQLGDPIEVQALSNAYGKLTEDSCALSSVKSQIGHLGAGAGVLGLIRAALSVYHGYLPPNLGFERSNPELGLDEKGFYVPPVGKPWESPEPRYAGVSSFGIGGTNTHVVLGQALQQPAFEAVTPQHNNSSSPSNTANRQSTPPPWDHPGYSFNLRQYTVFEQEFSQTQKNIIPPKQLPESEWLSQMVWQPVCRIESNKAGRVPRTAVVLLDANSTLDDLLPLNEVYNLVVPVFIEGQALATVSDNISVNPFCKSSVEQLTQRLANMDLEEVDWIHSLPLFYRGTGDKLADLQQAQSACLDSLTYFLQAQQECDLKISRICLLSSGALPVFGTVNQPQHGMLAGPLSVIPQEFGIQTLWLDVEDIPSSTGWSEIVFALSIEKQDAQRLALRNGFVWQPKVSTLSTNNQTTAIAEAEKEGLFVVTGGSGAIGTQVCKSLLSDPQSQVAIVSRNPSVPADLLQEISRIHLIKADIGNPDTWATTLDSIAEINLPITGIVHASGVGEGNLISFRDPANAHKKMRSKYEGSIFVEHFIERFQPARAIYCSSVSAVLGGAGQLDYASSNALMDSFAHFRNPAAPHTVRTSINWEIWNESGMAVSAELRDELHQQHLKVGLSNDEGRRIFSQIRTTSLPQVLVSTCDIEDSQYFYRSLIGDNLENTPDNAETKIVTIQKQTETLLLEQLGLDQIDPDECLHDLGMDSLTLLDLVGLLEKHGVRLLLSQVPRNSSLRQIMELAEQQLEVKPNSNKTTWSDAIAVHEWQAGYDDGTVVLIHPVGGDVEAYRELAAKLPDTAQILVIADPRHSNPDLLEISLKERARVYADTLIKKLATRKVQLVGWSFGAWVAHEVALYFHDKSGISGQLTLIDPPAPNSRADLQQLSKHEIEQIFLKELSEKWGADNVQSSEEGMRGEQHEYREALIRCTSSNIKAMVNHQMRPVPSWKANVILASETAEGLNENQNTSANNRISWLEVLPNLQNWKVIEADHYSIMRGKALDDVLSVMDLLETRELIRMEG
ncbi:amino acid adenylation domain-containing protein (plasmid) [Microbulbifer sp. MKSA007]|nr:amino acid adenylation domain-containing protein [Microbulbifer sp. MKSA007]